MKRTPVPMSRSVAGELHGKVMKLVKSYTLQGLDPQEAICAVDAAADCLRLAETEMASAETETEISLLLEHTCKRWQKECDEEGRYIRLVALKGVMEKTIQDFELLEDEEGFQDPFREDDEEA